MGMMAKTKQYKEGIKVHLIPHKHIAILVSKKDFEPILLKLSFTILYIGVPEYETHHMSSCDGRDDQFDNEYILIMLSSNRQNNCIPSDCLWNHIYGKELLDGMNANMKGSETNEKHHGCDGTYFGFGLVAKYAIQEDLSINSFAGNNQRTRPMIDSLMRKLKHLMNNQQSVVPLSLYCGFLLTNTMIELSRKYPEDFPQLRRILQENNISRNAISCSNWICHNAQTRNFHQETDSSYTFITVPYWHPDYYKPEMKWYNKGSVNFMFKWTSKALDEAESRFFPLEMSDGISIMFTGFGCYHRQCRTNNGTFWNFASYQNKRFYDNLRLSIIRCLRKNYDEE